MLPFVTLSLRLVPFELHLRILLRNLTDSILSAVRQHGG